MKPKSKIIQVTPEVFTREELRRYEEKILDNKNLTEQEASRFFQDFPKFLTVGGYLDIAREVVLYKGDKQMYRVDFVRRKAGKRFWDFVELKGPNTPFVVKGHGDHWTFGAKINAAINQGQDYKDFFDEESNRINLELRTGIIALRPKLLIVGGRHSDDIAPLELKKLADRYSNIDIQTYDDLYKFAQENYEYGSGIIIVPSLQGHLPRVEVPEQRPRIFLSYAWEDKSLVRRLEGALRKAGAELWVDYKGVRGGQNLPARISDALERCNTLLLVWSEAASKSRWVELEWTNAIALQKVIIPCKLSAASLPAILANTAYVDFRDSDHGIRELLAALKLGSQPLEKQVKAIEDTDVAKSQQATGPPKPKSQVEEHTSTEPDTSTQPRLSGFLFGEQAARIIKEKDYYCGSNYIWSNPEGRGVKHKFKLNKDGKVVHDGATRLAWQQSGSGHINYQKAQQYVRKLNENRFTGHSDWRLPTLEEAMSLMDPVKNEDGLYIDSVFEKAQRRIWTMDKKSALRAWGVDFGGGFCHRGPVDGGYSVRAVR